MEPIAIGPLIVAAVALYVGAYHLSVSVRAPARTVDRAFGIHCLFAVAYTIASSRILSASSEEDSIAAHRFLDTWGLVVAASFAIFVLEYTRAMSPRIVYGGAALLVVAIAIVASGPDEWVVDGPLIPRHARIFGHVASFYETHPGPGARLLEAIAVLVSSLAIVMVVRHVRSGDPRAKPLAVAVAITIATAVHDILTEAGVYEHVYVLAYGYITLAVVMGFSLSTEVIHAAEVEATLRASEAKMREAQRLESLGRLAGGVAHDFNNMLAGVIAYADLLLRDRTLSEKNRSIAERIVEAGGRAADLTARLLAFARKTSGVVVPVDLHRTVDDALDLLERTIDPRITVLRSLDAERAIVLGDASQLQSAILNLGVNARDAMPNGGTLRFETRETRLDDARRTELGLRGVEDVYIVLSVIDDGVGIPDSIRRKIFEPFFTTKALGEGTGLGLAAVAATVDEMNGAIRVESAPGRGTTFELYLPLADSTTEFEAIRDSVVDRRFEGRVLVVDDLALVRDAITASLESLGFEVLTAVHGEDGVAVLRENPTGFRLVVMDLMMPRWSAEETLRAVHRVAPGLPVLLVSGYRGEAQVQALLALGAAGFLGKPFRMRELADAVEKALDRSGRSA